MNYDDVLRIRNAQNSMRKRFEDAKMATTEEIAEMVQTETARQIGSPRVTEIEAMIFRMRTELIDYIVAHGLVDGWTMDGALQPVENGKIPLTSDFLKDVVSKMGYLTEDQIRTFLEIFLPQNHYVSDENYVHTDNNFTDEDKTKLDGVEDGAEVNLVNDVTLDGKSVLINKVASLTAESIKKSYESNSNTNAFTDADKAKLAGIADGAEKNRVDDVLVNGRSVLNENKKAVISKEIIKQAYESNPNTNAFTDNEKSKLEGIASGAEVNLVNDVTLDGETLVENKVAKLTAAKVKSAYESNPDTNAFTDADKQAIADNTAKGEENASAIDRLSQEFSSSVGQIGQEIAGLQQNDTQLSERISGLSTQLITTDSLLSKVADTPTGFSQISANTMKFTANAIFYYNRADIFFTILTIQNGDKPKTAELILPEGVTMVPMDMSDGNFVASIVGYNPTSGKTYVVKIAPKITATSITFNLIGTTNIPSKVSIDEFTFFMSLPINRA